MKVYWALVLAAICLAIGIVFGAYLMNASGKPANDVELHSGTYQLLAVVEVEQDYALVVIGSEGQEPRYYRIDKKDTLNFEDILTATTVVKVGGDTKYIEFKP